MTDQPKSGDDTPKEKPNDVPEEESGAGYGNNAGAQGDDKD